LWPNFLATKKSSKMELRLINFVSLVDPKGVEPFTHPCKGRIIPFN
jgi:hypothetical protein